MEQEPADHAHGLATWRAFQHAHRQVESALESALATIAAMPLTWLEVLSSLAEAPDDRLRMQELADQVALSKSGVSRLIDRMERAGYVTRVPCELDRRGMYAVLTEQGRTLLDDVRPTHNLHVQSYFVDVVDPRELGVLHDVFVRLAVNAQA